MQIYLKNNIDKVMTVNSYSLNHEDDTVIFHMSNGQSYSANKCISLPKDCINCEQIKSITLNNIKD